MKRKLFILAGILTFIALAPVLELGFVRIEADSVLKKFLFLLLVNVNLVALGTLIFLVGRSLRRLYLEKKHGVLGHKFKTKVVGLFVILIFIPSGILFLMALGLGTNYIERLFTPHFRQPLESSIEVAKAIYEIERKRAVEHARLAASGVTLPSDYKVSLLTAMPSDATDAIRSAFEGHESAEVISEGDRDIVRAAVPSGIKGQEGVIVVESFMPGAITGQVQKIKDAYEDYIKLSAWGGPIKLNFFLILGFSSLMVISLALWASLTIASRITEPIKHLAEATEAIAGGDLSISVKTSSKDEIGLLINSFNHMIKELREGKESLQHAYIESDTRRLYLENILENIQSGVIFLNAKGSVMTINPSATRILGIKAQDVIGKEYPVILSGLDSDELKGLIKAINLKTFSAVEKEVTATVGMKKVILRVAISGLRDSGSGYLGLLVVFDDLTNLIKAQRALAWQEVAKRIAHEIKNPLTPIRLSTERMLKKWQENDADFSQIFERSTNTIIKEVEGLRRLVDEFSRFGKMPETKRTKTEVMPLIQEVVNLYKAYKNLHITVTGDDVLVDLDPEQFKRVLINLFDNAIEAMGQRGSITVEIRPEPEENRVFINVADDGPGIKEDDKEKLFLPYFSTKKTGTGLGLAIADRIIAEHGGSIRVSDNKPRGSVFVIELPQSVRRTDV